MIEDISALCKLAQLNQREELAISLRFVEGCTYEEIGVMLNVCKDRARQIIDKSLRKLRGPRTMAELL